MEHSAGKEGRPAPWNWPKGERRYHSVGFGWREVTHSQGSIDYCSLLQEQRRRCDPGLGDPLQGKRFSDEQLDTVESVCREEDTERNGLL